MQEQNQPGPSLEDQFQIYAKELGEMYLAEQKRRAELAEEKLVLEQRVKELEALNRMFQGHVARTVDLQDALQKLAGSLHQAVKETTVERMREKVLRVAEEANVRALEERLSGAEAPVPARKATRGAKPS